MMKNRMKNILNKEHNGVAGFEATLLSPLMFMTMLMMLYFFFMGVSHVVYSNIANSIASDLNMRQTGYIEAAANYSTMPRVWTYRVDPTQTGRYLSASEVNVSPSSPYLMSGLYASLDKRLEGFIIPFTEITGINVYTSKTIDPGLGKKLADTVIAVEISYKSFIANFGDATITMPTMRASGYNIIS